MDFRRHQARQDQERGDAKEMRRRCEGDAKEIWGSICCGEDAGGEIEMDGT